MPVKNSTAKQDDEDNKAIKLRKDINKNEDLRKKRIEHIKQIIFKLCDFATFRNIPGMETLSDQQYMEIIGDFDFSQFANIKNDTYLLEDVIQETNKNGMLKIDELVKDGHIKISQIEDKPVPI